MALEYRPFKSMTYLDLFTSHYYCFYRSGQNIVTFHTASTLKRDMRHKFGAKMRQMIIRDKGKAMKINPVIMGLGLSVTTLSFSVQGVELNNAITSAISTHPEVKAAQNEFMSRKSEERGAKAGYLPSLDIAAGIGRERTNSTATLNQNRNLTREETSASIKQLVFDGFATRSEVRRQRARKNSAKHTLASTKDNIALRTSEVYLSLLTQTGLLILAEQSLKTHRSIHDRIQLRNVSGVSSMADVNQIAARVALAESNVITAEANLLDGITNYYRVVGDMPEIEHLKSPKLNFHVPESLELAVESALRSHPTLLQANSDVKASHAQFEATGAAFLPDVRLEADAAWNNDIDGTIGQNDDKVIALRMRYNLYNGGADKARRKQSSYLHEESKDVRDGTRRQVIEGLRLSWSAKQSITAQLPYLKKHVDAATATKIAYEEQFNTGQGRTLLDLLNTENEVVDSQSNYIRGQNDKILAEIRVVHSMGSLSNALGL